MHYSAMNNKNLLDQMLNLNRNRIQFTVWSLNVILASMLAPQDLQADEGGSSFWLPGQFGSFAANPVKPGWSLSLTYYHASSSTGTGKM